MFPKWLHCSPIPNDIRKWMNYFQTRSLWGADYCYWEVSEIPVLFFNSWFYILFHNASFIGKHKIAFSLSLWVKLKSQVMCCIDQWFLMPLITLEIPSTHALGRKDLTMDFEHTFLSLTFPRPYTIWFQPYLLPLFPYTPPNILFSEYIPGLCHCLLLLLMPGPPFSAQIRDPLLYKVFSCATTTHSKADLDAPTSVSHTTWFILIQCSS